MANYTSSEESKDIEKNLHNNNQNFDKAKRKRITHFLIDQPLNHSFPIEKEHESLLSIGGA